MRVLCEARTCHRGQVPARAQWPLLLILAPEEDRSWVAATVGRLARCGPTPPTRLRVLADQRTAERVAALTGCGSVERHGGTYRWTVHGPARAELLLRCCLPELPSEFPTDHVELWYRLATTLVCAVADCPTEVTYREPLWRWHLGLVAATQQRLRRRWSRGAPRPVRLAPGPLPGYGPCPCCGGRGARPGPVGARELKRAGTLCRQCERDVRGQEAWYCRQYEGLIRTAGSPHRITADQWALQRIPRSYVGVYR